MDALLAYIPEWNYWLIAFGVSLLLNVYQFAHAHGLAAKLGHVFEHGHAPEGKAIVPAASVVAVPPTPLPIHKSDPWDKP